MFKTILFLCLFYTITRSFDLTIVHTNDIHARFEPFTSRGATCKNENEKCYGGVVRRSSYVKQVRDSESNVLVLDAGDQYQGTPWFFTYKGAAAAFFLNELQYTAMALGNHEFDNGVEGLKHFFENVSVPILCANLVMNNKVPDWMKNNLKDHHIVQIEGQKVGIIGYLTHEVPTLSKTEGLVFEDEEVAVRRVAKNLTEKEVHIIIALGHSGLVKDQKMAANIPEVDVFVGGHSHSFLYNGDPPTKEVVLGNYPVEVERKESKALVVQAGAYGKYVGRIRVTFDDSGKVSKWSGNPVFMNSSMENDNDLKENLDKLNLKVKDLYKKVMGKTAMYFDTENNVCRVKECEMGNMYADAMMDYMDINDNWNADLAIVNSGLFRASFDKGDITYGDALTVFPFSNDIKLVNMLGSDIKEVFEHSVMNFSLASKHGKFLQVSRVFVKYDLSQPNGQRVVDLKVYNNKSKKYLKISDTKEYSILIPSFLAKGGDGYKVLEKKQKKILAIDVLDLVVITSHFRKNSPIQAKLEGRINGMTTFPGWSNTYKEVPWELSGKSTGVPCRYHATFLTIIAFFLSNFLLSVLDP